MRSVVQFFLIFSLIIPLYAAQKEMYIIVGTFKSEARADAQLLALKDVMGKDAEIVDLRRSFGFDYVIKRSEEYNRVVITPFGDKDILQTVINTAREHYPDAYVGRYDTSKITRSSADAIDEEQVPESVAETSFTPADNTSNILLYILIAVLLLGLVWWTRRKKAESDKSALRDRLYEGP